MIVQNIKNGDGVAVVDPHGELVEGILQSIPESRMNDVVYFNPSDTDFHIGFNVLELIDEKYKHLVASGLMGIFTKIWANAWSARMEYILNNAILALLDTPGTTLLGITRMLVDKDYRQKIISNLKDPVIKAFWVHEFEAWQEKFRNEAIAPIQNKVGQFLSTSIIRNIVGQSKSTINIFDIMNEGKIFLVNVSKGRIGEDNSKLIGGMIITKLQLAAMERVRIPEEERRDFYLYVDEFQNFVTDSFASILSEARKYRLNLTVAHQYTAQLVTKESSNVRDAIFGNVGTMIVFRVGADDADFLEKEFAPEFTPEDIVNLPNYKIYLKLMIDGVTSRPFSAKTLPPIVKEADHVIEEKVIKMSRELYCRPRATVEREINAWSGMSMGNEDENSSGEKFKVECSSCHKETSVPFKPEEGRPVYCKDCLTKIKAGEMKPLKGSSMGPYRQPDDARYFKPLADLGIEFAAISGNNTSGRTEPAKFDQKQGGNNDRPKTAYVERDTRATPRPQEKTEKKIFSDIKKVFKAREMPAPIIKKVLPKENFALRDILNKTLAEKKVFPARPPESSGAGGVKEEIKIEPEPISLSSLRTAMPTNPIKPANDRSASAESMNMLKGLINTPTPPQQSTPSVKEVPEDVLRKVLEN
jgi:CxxC-x17-CxxC domain-containing protein